MEITMTGLAPQDMVVLMPEVFLGDGEAGEPLPAQVVALINAFAAQGYWPLDFGEDHGSHVELWFTPAVSVEEAVCQARFFIERGGHV